MAKRKKRSASKKTARRRTTADANAEETASGTPSLPQVHPPTRNVSLLIAAAALLAGWLIFLLVMALDCFTRLRG